MDLTLKSSKRPRCPGFTTEFHRWITILQVQSGAEFRTLTGFIHRRRTGRARAVDDSNPGGPNLEGHAALAVVPPKRRFASGSSPGHLPGDGCLLQIMALVRQTTLPTSLPCSNLSAWPNLAPTCARLFLLERDGRSYHCCSPYRPGLCRNPPRDNRRDKR